MLPTGDRHRAAPDPQRDPFDGLLNVVAARAERESVDDPGTTLVHQVMSLRRAAATLMPESYRVAYERNGAEFYETFTAGLDALYQQVHAAVESSLKLVGSRTQATLSLKNIASLESAIEQTPAHPLASPVRRLRRELGLLKWLCTVRNKAVQHRVENGYIGNRAIVLTDGFAEARAPLGAIDCAHVRKAQGLLRGYVRRYGVRLDVETESAELVTYLDLVSHSLYRSAPGEFDTARRVVQEARAHDLIVSRPMIENTAAALTRLVELAPANPDSPFAAGPASSETHV